MWQTSAGNHTIHHPSRYLTMDISPCGTVTDVDACRIVWTCQTRCNKLPSNYLHYKSDSILAGCSGMIVSNVTLLGRLERYRCWRETCAAHRVHSAREAACVWILMNISGPVTECDNIILFMWGIFECYCVLMWGNFSTRYMRQYLRTWRYVCPTLINTHTKKNKFQTKHAMSIFETQMQLMNPSFDQKASVVYKFISFREKDREKSPHQSG